MSCNHMRYYSDLILLASVWFVRSGQSYVVALYPVVSYFTPTFKGWHPSSSLARRTNRCVHANKEKTFWQLGWAFSFFLFTPSNLLGWLWQLMDGFWVPAIISDFCCFQLVQYNFSQQILLLQPPWREQVETWIQVYVYFFISTSWCN